MPRHPDTYPNTLEKGGQTYRVCLYCHAELPLTEEFFNCTLSGYPRLECKRCQAEFDASIAAYEQRRVAEAEKLHVIHQASVRDRNSRMYEKSIEPLKTGGR